MLDIACDAALNGIPTLGTAEELGDDYLILYLEYMWNWEFCQNTIEKGVEPEWCWVVVLHRYWK